MNIRHLAREASGYLIRGGLLISPLALTLYILYWIFRTVDQLLPIGIPGLGLVLTLLVVGLVGALSSNVIGSSILETVEHMVQRVPFVKLVYSSIKDLINTFVGDKKGFDTPVLVRLSPDAPARMLGFITRDNMAGLGLPDHVAVYFPQSYNFAGNLVLLPRTLIEPLAVSRSEIMTFIVSGGVSGLTADPPVLPTTGSPEHVQP